MMSRLSLVLCLCVAAFGSVSCATAPPARVAPRVVAMKPFPADEAFARAQLLQPVAGAVGMLPEHFRKVAPPCSLVTGEGSQAQTTRFVIQRDGAGRVARVEHGAVFVKVVRDDAGLVLRVEHGKRGGATPQRVARLDLKARTPARVSVRVSVGSAAHDGVFTAPPRYPGKESWRGAARSRGVTFDRLGFPQVATYAGEKGFITAQDHYTADAQGRPRRAVLAARAGQPQRTLQFTYDPKAPRRIATITVREQGVDRVLRAQYRCQ